MRYTLALVFALLAGCVQVPITQDATAPAQAAASACTTTYTGPCVEGKLSGSQDETWIPFSAYTSGNPVLTTEQWVTDNFVANTGGVITGNVDQRKVSNTQPAISIRESATATQSAPTALGVASEYLRLGGLEWGVNSYRMIGFGYGGLTDNAPASIGFQETNKTGNTVGRLLFATRATTTNVAPTPRMTIEPDGSILAATGYTPTNALSLTNKAYVDRFNYGTPQAFQTNTKITTLPNQSYFITWTNKMTLTIDTIANLKTNGAMPGAEFIVENFGPDGSVVQLSDACYNAIGDCKTTTMRAGEAYLFKMDTTNMWRSVQIQRASSTMQHLNTTSTVSKLHDGDTITNSGTSANTLTIPAATTVLYFRDGEKFTVISYNPSGRNLTLNFADNVSVPNPAASNGITLSKQVVIAPGETWTFSWSGTFNQWYGYPTKP